MDDNLKDEISRRRRDNWFDVFFAIEALGMTEDVVKDSLKKHIEKLSNVKDVLVYERDFKAVDKVQNPMKDVEEAYSQVVSVKFLVKKLSTLLNVVLTYGPSAVEILGPSKKDVDISEIQDVANVLAGLVHQFAAAGAGGIVITPDEKDLKK